VTAQPVHPDFWNTRYEAGRTPWDLGKPPAALLRYLARHPGHGAHVLIPGCGSGHEIATFAEAGYTVTAIDFSPPAVALARGNLPPGLVGSITEGDFFTHDFAAAPFDMIYERTFLCALPPGVWPRIVARMAALLKPGATLAGVYFLGGKTGTPPFGLSASEPEELFSPHFTCVADLPIPEAESLPLFAGGERWQEWRRRG
jgi:SAM-dependent methyltransferase